MIPTTIEAGVTLDFEITVDGYPPSDGWTLRFYLRGPATIDLVAVASGDRYRVQKTAVETNAWTAGEYTWKARVSNGADVVVPVGEGRITIAPNIESAQAGFDGRSQARKALEDAKTALAAAQAAQATAAGGRSAVEYSIGDRTTKYANADEAVVALIRAVRFWQQQVAEEQRAARLAAGLDAQTTYKLRIR